MIKSVQEIKIGAWVVRESDENIHVQFPMDVVRLWKSCIEQCSWFQPDKEAFVVFLLDTKGNVKSYNLVSLGLVDASLVHPREVFRPAIVGAAKSIIVAHNHPTGNTVPSQEDLNITAKLIESGKILNIPLKDHIVIGFNGSETTYLSMLETGLKDFS